MHSSGSKLQCNIRIVILLPLWVIAKPSRARQTTHAVMKNMVIKFAEYGVITFV